MPIYEVTDPQSGKTLELEGDSPPTEQELVEIFSSYQSDSNVPSFFDQKNVDITQNQDLSVAQNLMLSFAANDERRLEYLQQQFPNNQIGLDESGNILVDDKRINPRGFDVGDVGRNAGYAFNLAGQILGSIGGGVLGAPAGPAGIGAGIVGGGALGAGTGEALRLGVGKTLGLSQTEQEVVGRIAEEAAVAGVGEVIGLATLGTGAFVAKGPIGKTVSSIWRKTIDGANKMKFPVEEILKFTANINEDASRVALRENKPSQVLNEEFFRQDKGLDIAKKAIFGKEGTKIAPLEFNDLMPSGFTRGQEILVKSLKNSDNDGLDALIQKFTGMDNETLQIIKGSDVKELLKSENLADDAYLRVAEDVANNINKRRKQLGEAIEIKTNQAKGRFNFDDVALQAAEIAKPQLDNIIQQKGFEPKMLPKVKGYKELKDLMESFFGVAIGTADGQIIDSNGQIILRAAKPTKRPFGDLSKKDVIKLNNSIDNQISAIVTNKNIPANIRNAANEIRKSFKDSYYKQLNLGDEAKAFAEFARTTDNIQTQGRNGVLQLANTLKGASNTGVLGRADIITALNGVNSDLGQELIGKTARISAAQRIAGKVDAIKTLKSFESQITKPQILSSRNIGSQTDEAILFQIDNVLKSSKNPNISSRAFIDDSRRFLAAQEFNKNTANILRMQTVLGIMGVTSLPFGLGVGGMAGVAASQLTNPKLIAKILVKSEKAFGKKSLQKSATTIKDELKLGELQKIVTDPRTKAFIKSLLSRQLGDKSNRKKNPDK